MKSMRRVLFGALAIASWGFVGVARAQGPETATGAWRSLSREALQLTMQGSLVDYYRQASSGAAETASSTGNEKSSIVNYGLVGSGYGLGVGYAWDRLLLGARVEIVNNVRVPYGGGEVQALTIAFVPRFEYIFKSGRLQPYIAGLLPIEHSSGSSTSYAAGLGSDTTAVDVSSTRFGIGPALGMHAFLTSSFSLDPEISVVPSWGPGSSTIHGGGVDSPGAYTVSAVRVLLSLSLSGWIDTGGAPTPPPPREQSSEYPPVAMDLLEGDEPRKKPLSADIHLPNHRRLYIQVLKVPEYPTVLVRLSEPRNSAELLKCNDVSIASNTDPIHLAIRLEGDHYLVGRLPIRGLEVLAGIVDSSISVCGDQWHLGQESREQVQTFLKQRRELVDDALGLDALDNQPVELEPSLPQAPSEPNSWFSAPPSPASSTPTPTPAAPAPTLKK